MIRRQLVKFLLAPFLPIPATLKPPAKPKEERGGRGKPVNPNPCINPNLKPGEAVIDIVVAEEEDGSYSLMRTVDTCEGTWGKMSNIGHCPNLNPNIFVGIHVHADGISLLRPMPIQKEPIDYDALRAARYDIAGRRVGGL